MKLKIVLITIGLGIMAGFIIPSLLVYYQQQANETHPITMFDFQDNKWLIGKNISVISKAKHDYVLPGDELYFKLNVQIKNSTDLVYVIPKIYISVAGKDVQDYTNNEPTYSDYIGDPKQYVFYAAPGGLNKVHVDLFYKTIEYNQDQCCINSDFNFTVLSQSEKLQNDQNNYIVVGIVASTLSSAGAIIFTAYQTYQSRQESKYTFRPWIGRYPSTKPPFSENEINLAFRNWGNIPALKVTASSYAKIEGEEVLEEDWKHDPPMDMSPKEVFSHAIDIKQEILVKHRAGNRIHFEMLIKYTDPNGINGVYRHRGTIGTKENAASDEDEIESVEIK